MIGGHTNQWAWLWLATSTAVVVVGSVAPSAGCGMDSDGGYSPTTTSGSSTSGVGGAGIGGTTGSSTSGAPGTSSIEPVLDQCPDPDEGYNPYQLEIDNPAVMVGWTVDANDDYSSFCGGGANGERRDEVAYIQAMSRGTLTVEASSELGQPVVYVESTCGVRSTFGLPPDQLPCSDTAGQQIRLGVKALEEFYIIVEGGGSDEHYQVDVSLSEPICGDGVINPANVEAEGEQCDFGSGGVGGAGGAGGAGAAPVAPNGCDDSCRFETPTGDEDTCPGIAATAGQPVAGHTVGFQDDYQPVCAVAGGPDRLYFLALQGGELLHVSVEADFDVVLAVMRECAEVQPSHCQDSAGLSTQETLEFTAPESGTYVIVVDGYDGASWGSFTLTATKS